MRSRVPSRPQQGGRHRNEVFQSVLAGLAILAVLSFYAMFFHGNDASTKRMLTQRLLVSVLQQEQANARAEQQAAAGNATDLADSPVDDALASASFYDTLNSTASSADAASTPEVRSSRRVGGDGSADGSDRAHGSSSGNCKKLLWFTAVSQDNLPDELWESLSVAVVSARKHAPSLQPMLLFVGEPNERTKWFEEQGGIVIPHNLTFQHLLDEAVANGWHDKGWLALRGAYARLDVPAVVPRVLPTLPNAEQYSHDYVLYTDVDVMFFKDLDLCSFPQPHPERIMFGAESTKGEIQNSGVALMNVQTMAHDQGAFLRHAVNRQWQFHSHDQTLLLEVYEDRIDFLPDEFNWKAYWGESDSLSILHMHGPKAYQPCTRTFLKSRIVPPPIDEDRDAMCWPTLLPLLHLAKKNDDGDFLKAMSELHEEYVRMARLPRASGGNGSGNGGSGNGSGGSGPTSRELEMDTDVASAAAAAFAMGAEEREVDERDREWERERERDRDRDRDRARPDTPASSSLSSSAAAAAAVAMADDSSDDPEPAFPGEEEEDDDDGEVPGATAGPGLGAHRDMLIGPATTTTSAVTPASPSSPSAAAGARGDDAAHQPSVGDADDPEPDFAGFEVGVEPLDGDGAATVREQRRRRRSNSRRRRRMLA